MQSEEILQWLSDNHQSLILGGGAVSFISLFLPFWTGYGETVESWFYDTAGEIFMVSISQTSVFLIYLLLIIGLFYGYVKKFGIPYPHLYLAIGIVLFFLTLWTCQARPYEDLTGFSYGFILELAGALAVAIGGYYYYERNAR
jgi:hypothetical protein